MSHLIMLAPANFGSALAILGKQRVGRLKSWLDGVEPGTGVLDWLELGSADSWTLNTKWIHSKGDQIGPKGVFPFVITGEWIDRKFYDHLNPYTGELGSDGVVRVCAANMNSRYIRLVQEPVRMVSEKSPDARTLLESLDRPGRSGRKICVAPEFATPKRKFSPKVPLLVVKQKSHSGTSIGILRSVKARVGNKADDQTVGAILDCMQVKTLLHYAELAKSFRKETKKVQEADDERIEFEDRFLLSDRVFIRDRHSMIVFRLRDEKGNAITDYDLLLTANNPDEPEAPPNPNFLPSGLIADRQLNTKHGNTLSLYFNYQALIGLDELTSEGKIVRGKQKAAEHLGFLIRPRPVEGAVHFLPCELQASREVLQMALQPNQTTLVDIVLRRVVREGVFRLRKGTKARSFKRDSRGKPL
ncbi:MAG: phospholipase [Planctomycetes bacterium]|nr:phospholipase [Planctomycetota bacterium]